MELVFGVPIAFLIFLAGTRLYEQRGLSGPLDSLRAGRWHYLIAGFLFNLALRHSDLFPVSLNVLRNSFLEIGLAWFGLQTGLDFDLRRFRSEETRHLLLEAARSGLGFLATFVLVLLIAPYLSTFVGIHRPQGLIALLLASFVTTLRTPELIFHWGQKAFFYTSRLTFPPALCTNPVALILLGILFPFVSENPILNLGFVTTAGTTGIFVVLFGIGLLLGVMLDFIFRAYSEGRTCVYLSIGVLAALSGPCAMLGLPGIVVGFIGGAWLINTTVRRREVLELVEGGTGMIEPFFFLILGGVLAECWETISTNAGHLILFSLSILVVRSLFRASGTVVASRLFRAPPPWQVALGISIRPLGGLAVALAAQGLFLPLHLERGTLLASLVLAVFFSQMLPAPEMAESAPSVRPTIQD